MAVETAPWRSKSVHARRLTGSVLLATLLLAVARPVAAQDTRLLDAARAADSARVVALLEQSVSANTPQADGATALHWAAHWDDTIMADALIGAGADVDVANDFGATPLWLACLNGSDAMVRDPAGGRRRCERGAALGRDGLDDRFPHRVRRGGAPPGVPRGWT